MNQLANKLRLVIALLMAVVWTAPVFQTAAQDATPAPNGQTLGAGSPMFRGNAARTGATSDPGPAGPVAVVWTARTGGGPTPAVADGVVYVSGWAGNFYALDAVTGAELWSAPVQGSMSAPAVADGIVVVGGGEGLFAFDAATGEQLWHYVPNSEPVGQLPPGIVDSSPVIVDGTVYVGDGPIGGLFAVDLATGKERWTFETEGGSPSSPSVVDGVVYIGTDPIPYAETEEWSATIFAVDAATGEEIWRFAAGNAPESFTTSPAVADGVVYATSMEILGESPTNAVLHALDAATGTELWQAPAGHDVSSYLSASVDDGRVIFGTGSDNALVALDAKSGDELWRHPTGQIIWAAAIAAGVVYVADVTGIVFAIDAATGEELWSLSAEDGYTSTPAVAGGLVYFQNFDTGFLIAIGGIPAGATPTA